MSDELTVAFAARHFLMRAKNKPRLSSVLITGKGLDFSEQNSMRIIAQIVAGRRVHVPVQISALLTRRQDISLAKATPDM